MSDTKIDDGAVSAHDLPALLAEMGSLREALATAERERDEALSLLRKETARNNTLQELQRDWSASLSKALADAAVLREALEMLLAPAQGIGFRSDRDAALVLARAALSGEAGKALLEEVGRLRTVAEKCPQCGGEAFRKPEKNLCDGCGWVRAALKEKRG